MNKEQILYEDNDIIVCHKPAGIATQTARVGQKDMVSEVSNHIKAPIKPVHRLDQPVEGLLVFAKTKAAAATLGAQIDNGRMEKYYCAVVCTDDKKQGDENKDEITIINYLYKDNKAGVSYVVSKEKAGAKMAKLQYKILDKRSVKNFIQPQQINTEPVDINKIFALAGIRLFTGRHHQIRVQMSHAGMSLLGDYKYADENTREISKLIGLRQIALCSCKLVFYHPVTGEKLSFSREPENDIFRKLSFQNFSL